MDAALEFRWHVRLQLRPDAQARRQCQAQREEDSGSVEDRVHQRLSERFQGISGLFGLIPEVLSDLWVEAALENRERLDELMKEVRSDNRHLLHPFRRVALDFPDLSGWDRCTQVLHDAEASAWLKTGWN